MIRWFREWQLERVVRKLQDLGLAFIEHAHHEPQCHECQSQRMRYHELEHRLIWLSQKLWTTDARTVLR